jgi:prevent-host-death family protein
MKAVTIREAKARLNALVEAAERGEHVVLMRGSKHVAAIVPITADDLEIAPSLTDAQAERLWSQIHQELRDGSTIVFDSAEEAVAYMRTGTTAEKKVSPRAKRTGRGRPG